MKLENNSKLTRREFVKSSASAVVLAGCWRAFDLKTLAFGAHGTDTDYVCPPCGLECDKLTFDKPGTCPGCGMTLIEKSEADAVPTVAILMFDHAEIIDFAGPWEVFGGAGYKVFTVAEKTEPVNCIYGQRVA